MPERIRARQTDRISKLPKIGKLGHQLLAGMGFAVLERMSEDSFQAVGVAPEWFQRLVPDSRGAGMHWGLPKRFPLLEAFLPEAEQVWSSSEDGRVQSDLWSETDAKGSESHFRAWALNADGRHFLIFELANEAYKQSQPLLQYAHEISLQNELIQRLNRELQAQRDTAESLLLNILPVEVAEELRQKGMVDPRYYEDVTILFTDFQGFTASTEKLAAEDLVALLHTYFSAFDRVTREYGLEKLKTIGDSYMCVAGMPVRTPSHAVDAVLTAFAMLEEVRRSEGSHQVSWPVRIGLHTGSVISGVVGTHKFAFDIWGDSVNLASRMESSGEGNRINVSNRTWSRVKDFFACVHRGKVSTKDQRQYDMYFVEGALPALMGGCRTGVPERFAQRYKTYFRRELRTFPRSLLAPVPDD